MPVVKGKVGKSKVVKVKNETMPTPQGRRVIPRITSTMKVQAVKKEGAKRGKAVKVCVCRMRFACVHKQSTALQITVYSDYFCFAAANLISFHSQTFYKFH